MYSEASSEDARMSYADEDEELENWPASTPATPSSRRHLSDYEYDDEDYDIDPNEPTRGFATHTAFDAYFLHASKPSRTSANVFSTLVPPLTPEEYSAVLKKLQADPGERERVLWREEGARKMWFTRMRTELEEGFNLMLYGYGSKREFLNAFATHLSRAGDQRNHIVVATGFHPSFAFKDLLSAIEQIPGVLDGPSTSTSTLTGTSRMGTGLEAQTQRVHAFFSRTDADADKDAGAAHLYIIVHNIEGAAFRAQKNKAALALLALAPRIHIVASVDHIAASQRWSLSELFTRKPDPRPRPPPHTSTPTPAASSEVEVETGETGTVPRRGFAWLWHDLTTLAPYDFELAFADPTSLSGAATLRGARAPASSATAAVLAGMGTGAGAQGALVTETAARHVLASVTHKAKKLFVLLGSKQLEVMDASAAVAAAAGDPHPPPAPPPPPASEGAYDYDRLFAAARDNFVATNDTALRALLGEFRDHGLVVSVSTTGGTAEAMWIPMRREGLLRIVGELKAEGI